MAKGLDVPGYLIFVFVISGILSAVLVFYYAEAGTPWHTYPTIFACYYAAFGILFLVPIDTAMIVVNRVDPYPGTYYTDLDLIRPVYTTFFM